MLYLSRHESYRLVIKDPQHSYHIESINREWRKSVPLFLSTSHCEFYGTRCAPKPDESSFSAWFACYLRISTFIVCRTNNLKFIEIGSASLLIWPYKILPFTTKFIRGSSFFLCSFIFIAYFFCGLAGACVNPEVLFSNSLFVHSLVCLITHPFSWISAKFVSALLLCMLYLSYYFQPEVNT